MSPKVITVFGATGAQGGAVVKALAIDPQFKVRAVTRNPNSDAAIKLKDLKIDIVKGDLEDIESVKKVLTGADGCFLVTKTEYSVQSSYDKEMRMGKNVANACAELKISHVVYSTVVPKWFRDLGIPCAELDAKVDIYDYMRSKNLNLTGVSLSFYFENMTTVFKPQRIAPGTYGFGLPLEGKPWAMTSVHDLGQVTRQIFLRRDDFLGRIVEISTEELTLQQMCDMLNKHCRPAVFKDLKVSLDRFKKLPIPRVEDIAVLFELNIKSNNRDIDTKTIKDLHPSRKTFEDWVISNKSLLRQMFP